MTPLQWWPTQRETDLVPFLVIAGLLLAALVIWRLVVLVRDPGTRSKAASTFSSFAFHRAARRFGLGDEDAAFLEACARKAGISSPEFVFRNEAKLDSLFKSAFSRLEKDSDSETVADERKARLFAIRERIDAVRNASETVVSTQELAKGTPMSFVTPQDQNYPTIILATEPGGMALDPARDAYGETRRFLPGTRLTFYFYARNQQGFRFTSRVRGYAKVDGKTAMVVSHTGNVEALPSRRHARREMNAPCRFARVSMISDGAKRNPVITPVAEKTMLPGTIVDVSAGGCSIRTASPLQSGEYLKMEFSGPRHVHAVWGEVLRLARVGTRGGTMHVRFVKASRRALNDILAFVYDYSD